MCFMPLVLDRRSYGGCDGSPRGPHWNLVFLHFVRLGAARVERQ